MSTVILTTPMGDISIALDTERAPTSAANFLNYVEKGLFNGASFYRALDHSRDGRRVALVQGGLLDFDDMEGTQARMLPPIEHEGPGQTGLKNVKGSVSLARLDPGTAQSEFFINLDDAPMFDELPEPTPPMDGLGYAVFGYVTSGMEVLEAMLQLERKPTPDIPPMDGQVLKEPVRIESARISE